MSSHIRPAVAVASLLLLVPALTLSIVLLFGALFARDTAVRILEFGMDHSLGKILFSPLLVLGGVLGCLALNVWQVCSLSAEFVHGTWLICLSIRRRLGHLILVGLGLALGVFWLARAFVEHFTSMTR